MRPGKTVFSSLLFLVFHTVVASGQDSIRPKVFTLGFLWSFDYSNRILEPLLDHNPGYPAHDIYTRALVDTLDRIESGKITISAGIRFDVRLSKYLSLRLGLNYSDKGLGANGYYEGFWAPVSGPSVHLYEKKKRTAFNYVEMPFIPAFTLPVGKTSKHILHAYAGFIFATNTGRHDYDSRRFKEDYYNTQTGSTDTVWAKYHTSSFGLLQVGVIGGTGFEFPLNDKFNLLTSFTGKFFGQTFYSRKFMQEPYNNGLENSIRNLFFREKPWSLGIEFILKLRQ